MWCFRYLSIGGRLVLAKAVLESLPVYWLSLYKVPATIMDGIRRRITTFLWFGGKEEEKLHLARWNLIARPKSLGGWGLQRLEIFSLALRMKSFWRGLFSDTLWHHVLVDKYLK